MRKTVDVSNRCFAWSMMVYVLVFMIAYGLIQSHDIVSLYVFGGVMMLFMAGFLMFAPMWIEVDDRELMVYSSCGFKCIPLSEVESVRRCNVPADSRRVCGSSGWFGYWGLFTSASTGDYRAAYGRRSQCFMVTLRNGKRYILGCKDVDEMVASIKERCAEAGRERIGVESNLSAVGVVIKTSRQSLRKE